MIEGFKIGLGILLAIGVTAWVIFWIGFLIYGWRMSDD